MTSRPATTTTTTTTMTTRPSSSSSSSSRQRLSHHHQQNSSAVTTTEEEENEKEAEEERVCNQIRQALENVSFITSRTRSMYSAQCGNAAYCLENDCWKVHHTIDHQQQHQQQRQGRKTGRKTKTIKPTLVAEIRYKNNNQHQTKKLKRINSNANANANTKRSPHHHHPATQNNRKWQRNRPVPPCELVESLLMCAELKSWLSQCKDVLSPTERLERMDSKIAKIDHLNDALPFLKNDLEGNEINFSIFISMINKEEDVYAVLSRLMASEEEEEEEAELHTMKEYRGWVVEKCSSSSNNHHQTTTGNSLLSASSSSSSSAAAAASTPKKSNSSGSSSILMNLDSLRQHKQLNQTKTNPTKKRTANTADNAGDSLLLSSSSSSRSPSSSEQPQRSSPKPKRIKVEHPSSSSAVSALLTLGNSNGPPGGDSLSLLPPPSPPPTPTKKISGSSSSPASGLLRRKRRQKQAQQQQLASQSSAKEGSDSQSETETEIDDTDDDDVQQLSQQGPKQQQQWQGSNDNSAATNNRNRRRRRRRLAQESVRSTTSSSSGNGEGLRPRRRQQRQRSRSPAILESSDEEMESSDHKRLDTNGSIPSGDEDEEHQQQQHGNNATDLEEKEQENKGHQQKQKQKQNQQRQNDSSTDLLVVSADRSKLNASASTSESKTTTAPKTQSLMTSAAHSKFNKGAQQGEQGEQEDLMDATRSTLEAVAAKTTTTTTTSTTTATTTSTLPPVEGVDDGESTTQMMECSASVVTDASPTREEQISIERDEGEVQAKVDPKKQPLHSSNLQSQQKGESAPAAAAAATLQSDDDKAAFSNSKQQQQLGRGMEEDQGTTPSSLPRADEDDTSQQSDNDKRLEMKQASTSRFASEVFSSEEGPDSLALVAASSKQEAHGPAKSEEVDGETSDVQMQSETVNDNDPKKLFTNTSAEISDGSSSFSAATATAALQQHTSSHYQDYHIDKHKDKYLKSSSPPQESHMAQTQESTAAPGEHHREVKALCNEPAEQQKVLDDEVSNIDSSKQPISKDNKDSAMVNIEDATQRTVERHVEREDVTTKTTDGPVVETKPAELKQQHEPLVGNAKTKASTPTNLGTQPPTSAKTSGETPAIQATSLRRSKRPHRSKVDDDFIDPRQPRSEKEDKGRISLRQRKPRVTFAEEENECFPHDNDHPPQTEQRKTRPARSRRRNDKQQEIPALEQPEENSSRRSTRSRNRGNVAAEVDTSTEPAPASKQEDDSSEKISRPRRTRTVVERYTDAQSEKLEELASSSIKVEDEDEQEQVELSGRATRSRRTRSFVDDTSSQVTEEAKEGVPTRISRTRRTRAPVDRYTDTAGRDANFFHVTIKVIGEESLEPLEAVMTSEGIPRQNMPRRRREPNPPSSQEANKYSLRARRTQSYHEGDDDISMEEPPYAEAGASSEDSDDDDGPILVVTPFIMNRKNILKIENLVKDYEEVCHKRHGTCFSIENGKDISAKNSLDSLQKQLDTLDRKYPMEEEDEDEEILAEQQLHTRTQRVMQGRRSQEQSMRMKEKEQAEHMANLLLQKEWTSKKKAPTLEELEWKEIVNRPILNSEARSVRGKRIAGKERCPCAAAYSLRGDEEPPACSLCVDTTNIFEAAGEPVPVKGIMPLFREIDTDSPEFLERDEETHESLEDAPTGSESDDQKKARVSKRMKFDPRRRRETKKKLAELRYSMEFIEQYNNYGLLPKITTGS